jgi:hypothetical protein
MKSNIDVRQLKVRHRCERCADRLVRIDEEGVVRIGKRIPSTKIVVDHIGSQADGREERKEDELKLHR